VVAAAAVRAQTALRKRFLISCPFFIIKGDTVVTERKVLWPHKHIGGPGFQSSRFTALCYFTKCKFENVYK
jgi:hypothetical protein